jgi:hypothetical protein
MTTMTLLLQPLLGGGGVLSISRNQKISGGVNMRAQIESYSNTMLRQMKEQANDITGILLCSRCNSMIQCSYFLVHLSDINFTLF